MELFWVGVLCSLHCLCRRAWTFGLGIHSVGRLTWPVRWTRLTIGTYVYITISAKVLPHRTSVTLYRYNNKQPILCSQLTTLLAVGRVLVVCCYSNNVWQLCEVAKCFDEMGLLINCNTYRLKNHGYVHHYVDWFDLKHKAMQNIKVKNEIA